jgi:putative intracellular protease/amidase
MRMKFLLALVVGLVSLGSGWAAERKPILLVLTNHDRLGETGQPTGFYLSEAAHPWEIFRAAGYPVRLASPQGGFAPVDPKSLDGDDAADAAFLAEFGKKQGGRMVVPRTLPLAQVRPEDYAAIFFAGGHGTMWDFPDAPGLAAVTAKIFEQGGVVGAVCHGPAALVHIALSNGRPLVAGRKVAAFTNAEEDAVGLTAVMPFLLETKLREAGAEVVLAPNFQENAVRDGRLVTGQNPASARKAAELVLAALKGTP